MAQKINHWARCVSHAVKAPSVRPTLPYTNSETVIPANAGIQLNKTGFRVTPGMTIMGKGSSTHYTGVVTRKFLRLSANCFLVNLFLSH